MKIEHMKVREACRRDIAEIIMIANSSIIEGEDEGFGGANPDSPFKDAAKLAAAWQDPNRVGTEEVLVAEIDGRVVGVVTVENRDRELELVDIDVTMRHQGKGIGTLLVRYVEKMARERGKAAVTLGTSRNAEGMPWRSLPWWQSRGYNVTHEEENAWTRYIGPGAREIRMRKDL